MPDIKRYSRLSREEALSDRGITDTRLLAIHKKMLPHLVLIDAPHLDYEGGMSQGQLVVHEGMHDTFSKLLEGLIELEYPIQQIRPMVEFGWSDPTAMRQNNTSVYRPSFIGDPAKGKVSEHTRGTAIDLNPLDNPVINPDHTIEPKEAIGRMPREDAVIFQNLEVIALLHDLGLEYGGYWNDPSHPEDYYGHILSDRHHAEARPAMASGLVVPEGIW